MDTGHVTKNDHSSGPSRRTGGVIEAWHARSRADNNESSSLSPLEENPLKQNVEDVERAPSPHEIPKHKATRSRSPEPNNGAENTFSAKVEWPLETENDFSAKVEWPHQRDNVSSYSRPVPQFEDEEEYPEISRNEVGYVDHARQHVTPQPWRTTQADERAAEQVGRGGSRESSGQSKPKTFERNVGSPGISPLKPQRPKPGREPSYQMPLVSGLIDSRFLYISHDHLNLLLSFLVPGKYTSVVTETASTTWGAVLVARRGSKQVISRPF